MHTIPDNSNVQPVEKQKVYPYYIENPVEENRVERFLEAFARY